MPTEATNLSMATLVADAVVTGIVHKDRRREIRRSLEAAREVIWNDDPGVQKAIELYLLFMDGTHLDPDGPARFQVVR